MSLLLLLHAPTDTYALAVNADSPVAWWRGDGNPNDSKGGAAGTLTNGATYGTAVVPYTGAQAFNVDGLDDFVSIPHQASLNLTTAMSVEAWFVADVITGGSGYRDVVSKTSVWAIELNAGRPEFYVAGAGAPATSPMVVTVGQAYHVVGTYDGATIRMYVNGVSVATQPFVGAAGTNTSPAYIGSWNGTADFFDGALDEVAVYNAVLSPTRVAAHYTAGGGVISTPATAAGAITLGGSAAATSTAAASGSITLGGSATAAAPVAASGSISLGGTTTARATAAAAGSVTLGGTTTATITATAAGSITLGGTGTARGVATAAGTVTLSGTATSNGAPTPATAAGSIALAGSTTARAAVTATGGIVLGGSSTAAAPVAATGSIVLGGAITARVPATAAGLITLSGLANGAAVQAAEYAPHVYVTATVAFTPATATLAGDGTSTAALTKPSGFGEAFGEAFGGWQTTVTASLPFVPATAVLAADGTSTAVLASNGASTAVASEVPVLAELQLV